MLVTRRSAAKLDESAANIYFIRTCPISTDGLIVWRGQATRGLILLVTLSHSARSSPKWPNKYVKKDKRRIEKSFDCRVSRRLDFSYAKDEA